LREDVLPFTALMPELDAVMLAHVEFPNIDPEFPASLSRRMIQGFLRDQLGFDHHVVLTDDLDMGAIADRYGRPADVKLAIEAGNDLALICHRTDSAEAAAKAISELPSSLTDDAHRRVDRLRKKLQRPPVWSDAKWQETLASLEKLAASVPDLPDPASSSPVAGY
jgi:beta-N-acetylhexosaminidase